MEILPDVANIPNYEWVMTLFDDAEYVLSQEEYEGFKRAALADVKILHFDTFSVAIGQIKKVERRTKRGV